MKKVIAFVLICSLLLVYVGCKPRQIEPSKNQPSTAYIDSVEPTEATAGEEVAFTGHGTDPDGTVVAYRWRSSIDKQISTSDTFTTSELSPGEHTIFFKVQDNNGVWSPEVKTKIKVTVSAAAVKEKKESEEGEEEMVTTPEVVEEAEVPEEVLTPPLIATFYSTPGTILKGQSSNLNWNILGADSANIESIGSVSLSGSKSVSPTSTTTYKLTASNEAGSVEATTSVTVTTLTLAKPGLVFKPITPRPIGKAVRIVSFDDPNEPEIHDGKDFLKVKLSEQDTKLKIETLFNSTPIHLTQFSFYINTDVEVAAEILVKCSLDRYEVFKETSPGSYTNKVYEGRPVIGTTTSDGRSVASYKFELPWRDIFGDMDTVEFWFYAMDGKDRLPDGGRLRFTWSTYNLIHVKPLIIKIVLTKLKCQEEMDWDRGSNSDEPYVIVTGFSTRRMPNAWSTGRPTVFGDVDSGEERTIPSTQNLVFEGEVYPDEVIGLTAVLMENDGWTGSTIAGAASDMAGSIAGLVSEGVAETMPGLLGDIAEAMGALADFLVDILTAPIRLIAYIIDAISGAPDDRIGSPKTITFTYDQLKDLAGTIEGPWYSPARITFRGGGATYHLYYQIEGQ